MLSNLKKTQLTFAETLNIVQDVVDTCFDTDEDGNDIDFRPEVKQISLQSAFYENYIGLELTDNFEEDFAKFMAIDIDSCIFNKDQWYAICRAIDDKIEFRKQKMLQKTIKVTSVLDEEIIKLSDILGKTVETLPKSFDYSSIQPFIEKINSMKSLDEKKLVKAVANNNHSLKNKLFGHLKSKKAEK